MQRIATMGLEVSGDFAAEPHEFVNIRLAGGAYIRPVYNTPKITFEHSTLELGMPSPSGSGLVQGMMRRSPHRSTEKGARGKPTFRRGSCSASS